MMLTNQDLLENGHQNDVRVTYLMLLADRKLFLSLIHKFFLQIVSFDSHNLTRQCAYMHCEVKFFYATLLSINNNYYLSLMPCSKFDGN